MTKLGALRCWIAALVMIGHCQAADPEYAYRGDLQSLQRVVWENVDVSDFYFMAVEGALIFIFGFGLVYGAMLVAFLLREEYPVKRKRRNRTPGEP